MVILVFLRSNPRIKIPDFFKEEGLRKLLSHLAGVHESRWFVFFLFCFFLFYKVSRGGLKSLCKTPRRELQKRLHVGIQYRA